MNPSEMTFNVNLSFWQKVLLLVGWHIQVRVYGPLIQWGVTHKPLSQVDLECLEPRFKVRASIAE